MTLRLTMVQTDIAWEDKERNFCAVEAMLSDLAGKTDLAVLPEMFSTGFSMRSRELAEPSDGPTMARVRDWAARFDMALYGSFICEDGGDYYNRGFFVAPGMERHYDKRHLFRMGSELRHYSAGSEKIVVSYKGFNILPLICYDLRFPVWARNVGNAYDLVLYIASWPETRINAWNTLIQARAIENQAYACGVNRCGVDGLGLRYNGNSLLVDPRGAVMAHLTDGSERAETLRLSLDDLAAFREKFPAWKDADAFTLEG